MEKFVEFDILKGKVLKDIKVDKVKNVILFIDEDGVTYKMFHEQDCCEGVWIEDICGEINNLINNPIVIAEQVTRNDLEPLDEYDECYTWTFYKLATIKGYVTIRWYGTSNGWYSEEVDFTIIKK